ncbi:MAG: tetratricopeptide repeat protein [Planctomycetota bacterium]
MPRLTCGCRLKVGTTLWQNGVVPFIIAFAVFVAAGDRRVDAQEAPDVLALYADAANFQTNGAVDLAIETWEVLLKRFPKSELAPKASHYLGVCFMQSSPPKWNRAAEAFRQALSHSDFELREESLANRGYCLYATADSDASEGKVALQTAIDTYSLLIKEYEASPYLDQALFYSGEAAYSLDDLPRAIDYYNQLLRSPLAKESSLRCDALYARGVAQQELGQSTAAKRSLTQYLGSCAEDDSMIDVRLRLGDLAIESKSYGEAVGHFDALMNQPNVNVDDASYAMVRKGFALSRSNRLSDAFSTYESLIKRFPDSSYADAATLASGQTAYQIGDDKSAMTRFQQVIKRADRSTESSDIAAATEATHWLARIKLKSSDATSSNSASDAFELVQRRLRAGVAGKYAAWLRLDAAEALSRIPDRRADALTAYRDLATSDPDGPLAARAFYEGAFVALQLSQFDDAIDLCETFAIHHGDDPLWPDVRFVHAEAMLQQGRFVAAAERYDDLLESKTAIEHPQRRYWMLRAASAWLSADQPDRTVQRLQPELRTFDPSRQLAEARFLLGQAKFKLSRFGEAADDFRASRRADSAWSRSEEAWLLAGKAELAAGDTEAAMETWQRLIDEAANVAVVDQARYQLGQQFATKGDYESAVSQFEAVTDESVRPFALYALGAASNRVGDFASADASLGELIETFAEHRLTDQARLSRGIALRNLDRFEEAKNDLKIFLETAPTGTPLGHALFELGLVYQGQNALDQAVAVFRRVLSDVPEYPNRNQVRYELAWSLRDLGEADAAAGQFEKLLADNPDPELIAEAAFYVGQQRYADGQYEDASRAFAQSTQAADDGSPLQEKSLYRLGWSFYKQERFEQSEKAFEQQCLRVPEGPLLLDAMLMIGESRFQRREFDSALKAYSSAREQLETNGDSAKSLRDPAERQIRELILLHGGQSAAQVGDFQAAIEWYDELRRRFPATTYLPQVFYETGFAHQQSGKLDRALKFYAEVADNYRIETAARARFMMGEIHFEAERLDQAIPQFQRVMFGFGAESAPDEIKNWQAKSGFEAARCGELLVERARTDSAKSKAIGYARRFYSYVIQKHPSHELASKARQRLAKLPRD